MKSHTAKAEVPLRRQRTQYSCMSASMSACLNALGHTCTEDEVNEVMGARPMKGAAWEQALACAQHYGVRGTLVCPSTVPQLRTWTDAGKPVMIAWNPEGREWSHASVVFDVTDELPSPVPPECTVTGESGPWVWVADSNIPNPEKTVRIVCADVFYSKWFEKWPNYLVRRPALMLDREITPEGRQVMASTRTASWESERRYDKRQELRGELWEEDNPGLAAYRENQREEKSKREEAARNNLYVKAYFYLVALPGWATTVDSPEIRIWVNQVLSGIPKVGFANVTFGDLRLKSLGRKAWPTEIINMYGGKNLSDESRESIFDIIDEGTENWPQKFVPNNAAKTYFEWFEKHIPQKLEKYKALASKYKTYVPPPNVRIPSAPVVKTVVYAEAAEKIQILTDLSGKIQDPTIAQVLEDYTAGAKPTEDQLKKIRNLLYRVGMRPQADMFRMASRPGPHQDRWPSQDWSRALEAEIDLWESKLRNIRGRSLLEDTYPNAKPEDLLLVKKFVALLKKGDRKGAKPLAELLYKKFPGSVGNPVWGFILDGRMASLSIEDYQRSFTAKAPQQVGPGKKDPNRMTVQGPAHRNPVVQGLIERGTSGAGKHKNPQDFARGHARRPKHKGRGYEEGMEETINASSVEGEMKKISPPVEAEPSSERVARAHVAAQSPGYAITNPLRFGLMPLVFMYGQILEKPRQMVVLSGESLRVIKTKKIVVLVGVDERGQPILARNEAELKAKTEALNQSRLHHESAR